MTGISHPGRGAKVVPHDNHLQLASGHDPGQIEPAIRELVRVDLDKGEKAAPPWGSRAFRRRSCWRR